MTALKTEMKITHRAVARSGDIPGMSGPDEEPVRFDITTKAELDMWKDFNRANKDWLEISWVIVLAGREAPRRLYDKLLAVYIRANDALREHYGAEVWSKYHSRTTWVIVKETPPATDDAADKDVPVVSEEVREICTIMICPTGPTWDVVEFFDDGSESGDAAWCETKSEAIKVGQRLFRATTTAKRLVSMTRSGDSRVLRSR